MQLSASLRAALENLHQKNSGVTVDWINIADARALTELGLAVRSHQGWTITDAGKEAHSAEARGPDVVENSGGILAYP
jgi:hypothetical protein